MRCNEYSECFADEFKYSSDLQSHEQSLNYLILGNLCKTMKIIRMTEIFKVNESSILYMTVTNQTSESQLDDYYMNTVMKLALNIITEYKSSLKKKVNVKENSTFI